MCHKVDKLEISRLFDVEFKKFHDLKQELKGDFADEIEKADLGSNPDVGWCGEPKKKQICFRSRRDKKSICLEYFISDYK